MTGEVDKLRFFEGETAEDFANKVADGLRDESGKIRTPGVVRIACEDFTLPDNLVMLGTTEIEGMVITYYNLFAGAIEYFHGIRPSQFRPVQIPEAVPMTPFSMALEINVEGPVGSGPRM